MQKLLVLGVGNILLMDEGLGVHAVKDLQKESWPPGVDFLDGGTFTQDVFYLFEGYEQVLVLDIVKAAGQPGELYHMTEQDLIQDKQQALSLHDIDLLDSLRMAELSGHKPRLEVLGLEPERIDWGLEMTSALQQAYSEYLQKVRQRINSLLQAKG
ncbi:MAG: HyaD/HybD family hydrogenase maturation endopeptidase [Desulfohalobiaceae bacterium]